MTEEKKYSVLSCVDQAEKLGSWLAKSGMFGVKTMEQGAILAITCLSENLTPISFARKYHIIDGKPTMRADAMLAEFCRAGGSHRIMEYSITSRKNTTQAPEEGVSLVGKTEEKSPTCKPELVLNYDLTPCEITVNGEIYAKGTSHTDIPSNFLFALPGIYRKSKLAIMLSPFGAFCRSPRLLN